MKATEVITKNKEPLIFGDSIKIVGDVEIRNGNTVIKAKNRFTQTILAHISNIFVLGRIGGPLSGASWWDGPMLNYNIYLGRDTTTPTVYNTPALYSPIGTAPGTPPNLKFGSTTASGGVFKILITATWNTGTVSGTVGEMALYLNLTTALKGYQWGGYIQQGGAFQLGSRLSVKDLDFTPFTIIEDKALAVTWIITVSF